MSLSITRATTIRILSMQVRLFVRIHVMCTRNIIWKVLYRRRRLSTQVCRTAAAARTRIHIIIQDLQPTYNASRGFYLFSIFFFSSPQSSSLLYYRSINVHNIVHTAADAKLGAHLIITSKDVWNVINGSTRILYTACTATTTLEGLLLAERWPKKVRSVGRLLYRTWVTARRRRLACRVYTVCHSL